MYYLFNLKANYFELLREELSLKFILKTVHVFQHDVPFDVRSLCAIVCTHFRLPLTVSVTRFAFYVKFLSGYAPARNYKGHIR